MKKHNILATALLSGLIVLSSQAFAESASVSDSVITTKVKAKIVQDKFLSALENNVSTVNDGVVILSGQVNSESDAKALVQIAESVDGVRDVDTTKLMIKDSKHPMNDAYITAKITGKFIQERLFDNKDVSVTTISIETNNGIVHLTGTVKNKEQIKNAINLALSVDGVKKVESRLKVKS